MPFLSSACDRKPSPGFKPLTPPTTPVSPCGPASTPGTPPHPHVANGAAGPIPVHKPALPVHSHSHNPPFAVPCAPISQNANNFTAEHRLASGQTNVCLLLDKRSLYSQYHRFSHFQIPEANVRAMFTLPSVRKSRAAPIFAPASQQEQR